MLPAVHWIVFGTDQDESDAAVEFDLVYKVVTGPVPVLQSADSWAHFLVAEEIGISNARL